MHIHIAHSLAHAHHSHIHSLYHSLTLSLSLFLSLAGHDNLKSWPHSKPNYERKPKPANCQRQTRRVSSFIMPSLALLALCLHPFQLHPPPYPLSMLLVQFKMLITTHMTFIVCETIGIRQHAQIPMNCITCLRGLQHFPLPVALSLSAPTPPSADTDWQLISEEAA